VTLDRGFHHWAGMAIRYSINPSMSRGLRS
jgi:hypothetical protein